MRNISKTLHEDEWFQNLERDHRLAWMLMINNLADDQGRFELNVSAIRDVLFSRNSVSDEDILDLITGFALAKKILVYEVDGMKYCQLANWWKYQDAQLMERSMLPAPSGWADHSRFNSSGYTRSRRE